MEDQLPIIPGFKEAHMNCTNCISYGPSDGTQPDRCTRFAAVGDLTDPTQNWCVGYESDEPLEVMVPNEYAGSVMEDEGMESMEVENDDAASPAA